MDIGTLLLAIAAIFIGAISCFYGYRVFRIVLPFVGLVYGYLLGISFVAPGNTLIALIIGVVFAIIIGALAYFFWSIMFTISGVTLGVFLGGLLAYALNAQGLIWTAFSLGGAVVVGLLFFRFRNFMVMIATAAAGAGAIMYGVGLVFSGLQVNGVDNNFIPKVILLVLAVAGFVVQYQMFKLLNMYDNMEFTLTPSSTSST